MDITTYLTDTNFTKGLSKQNKYIVVHYTANNGDTAMNNAIYFKSTYRGASAHYFVDENEIVQVVQDSDVAWHVGSTTYVHADCRNSNSIGIEMCSRIDSTGSYYIKDEVVASTVELVQYLQELYNIPSENIIRHYDVTGKICPEPFVKNSVLWANFKEKIDTTQEVDDMTQAEVIALLDAREIIYNTIDDVPDWGKDTVQKLVDKGFLQGDGTGLNIDETMLRILVINDRTGLYG